jgi:intergrase/recombinase
MRKLPAGSVRTMLDRIADAIAKADGSDNHADPERYRRFALAALKALEKPTESMIDAAHKAVWSDAYWAINSRRDFQKAVRAMIRAAMKDGSGWRRYGLSFR